MGNELLRGLALPATIALGCALGGCSAPFEAGGAGAAGGATTTTTTSGTSGGAGGAGGRTGQGGTGVAGNTTGSEDCSNGSDDDGDQLTDCADPDCSNAGYACIAIPGGFTGPVTTASAGGPPCPTPWSDAAIAGSTGVSGDPYTCGCACDDPNNASCAQSTSIAWYFVQGCQQPNGSAAATQFCSNFIPGGAAAMRILPPALSGSCGPGSPSTLVAPPVQFQGSRSLCQAPGSAVGTGCDGGGVCAPPVSSGPLCFYKLGTDLCPSGFDQTILYQGNDDQRFCDCSCTFGGTCSASLTFYGISNCSGAATVVPADGACLSIPLNAAADKLGPGTPQATCQEAASAHGAVVPTEPLTLCCLPP